VHIRALIECYPGERTSDTVGWEVFATLDAPHLIGHAALATGEVEITGEGPPRANGKMLRFDGSAVPDSSAHACSNPAQNETKEIVGIVPGVGATG
jgi:hypothetical protein